MRKFANIHRIEARVHATKEKARIEEAAKKFGKTVEQVMADEEAERIRQREIDRAWRLAREAEVKERHQKQALIKKGPRPGVPSKKPKAKQKDRTTPRKQEWDEAAGRWVKITNNGDENHA